jgi:PAS domain S-box-containing protein
LGDRFGPSVNPFPLHMKRSHIALFRYLSALWVSGAVALALATWACFLLSLSSATAACVYLVIIVLLSLMDSFVTAVIFPAIAVGCLDFFFIKPLFAFEVANSQDLTTLCAFLITSIVITSLVRRLRRLGQAHHEQARLLDLTRDSVLVRDLENVITYWNRGGEDLYGWKEEEAVGKVAHQLLQTIFPAPLELMTEELFRSGHWEGELLHTRRDGIQVTVSSRWSVQRGDEGQPIGTLETNNDITERKRVEDTLRRVQETYLTEAQQLSHTGSFGWKVSSGEIFWSEEGFRIFGFDSTTRPSIELVLARVHPDDYALVRRVIDRAKNDRQDFAFEHRLRLPGGTVKHVRVVARAMRSETDNVDFVGAVMDVTSIRLAELELQSTRTELAHVMRVTSLGELTASIAHEVNQPLGAVVANAEACLGWLDRESPDLNEAHAAIERIVRDGHRAGDVIRRVRALIKRTDTQMAPLDVNEIVSEAMNIVENELLRHRVSQRMELSRDLPVVLGDRIQLQQVLLNLIINGIEAMQSITERQRELVIRSEKDEAHQVQVTVMDCGIGLSADSAQRIFDAFITTKSSGMGMGLSICRSIIQAHGGRIWACTNEPFGAAVQFTLPLHRPEPL